jgi:hypothetical protein
MTKAMDYLNSIHWKRTDWLTGYPGLEELQVRDKFICKFGFAILTDEIVQTLLPFSPIVEVGAGSGYWSYELNQAGAISIPTDPKTGRYCHFFDENRGQINWKETEFLLVEELTGIQAVEKYPNHSLLMVWPDMAPWPAETLSAYKGSTVLYVGEGDGGCTADEQFHKMLEQQFEEKNTIVIPQFWCIHDYLTVWSRRWTETHFLRLKGDRT